MKWLFYEKETNTKAKAMLIYSVKPPKELLDKSNYIEVENVPEPKNIKGKTALPYCNPQTNESWYEYVDRPSTEEEKTQELKQQVTDLNIAMANMMGV